MKMASTRPPTATAAEVVSLLRERIRPLSEERVPLVEACGRLLREDVLAPEDQPLFDRSSVDGYAVRRDDASAEFRVVDELRAGDWRPRELQPGEAVRIATGGALPGRGLQVIMREDVKAANGRVSIPGRNHELNIRFRGEDAAAGAVLVPRGTVLRPGALALLASVGCIQPLVSGLPRVLHVATGNEIVPPDQSPGPGQIRDSNSTLVRGFLNQWGIEVRQLRVEEDEPAVMAAAETAGAPAVSCDLLLISGGASVGEHDFTLRVLERAGFTIHVCRTTARPGKPLIVAQRGNTFAFGLPGNPLAHFVCLNLYVRAAIEAFTGLDADACPSFQAGVLDSDLPADGNSRETFWPAEWFLCGGAAHLRPLRWSSSGDLTSLATANALIRVVPGTTSLEHGRTVEFFPTNPFS